MKLKHWFGGAMGLGILGMMSSTVQAAPAGGPLPRAAAGDMLAVEKAAYRRCWWYQGRQHCRWYREYDDYSYYPYYYDVYPYYYGPSFGFFYGGRHRGGIHHRGGRRHR